MKLLDNYQISCWAFEQCKSGNDTEEIRSLINSSYWICRYCMEINDIKEMWSKIKSSFWANWYCVYVGDREEISKLIDDEILKKVYSGQDITEYHWKYKIKES